MTGNEPTSGTTTNFPMTFTNNAVLTWLWATNYWLDTAAGANGSVEQSNQWVYAGSNITVTATPSNYYHFSEWSGDTNDCSTNSNQITAPMTGPREISASFAENLVLNNTPEWWLAGHGLPADDTGAMYDGDEDRMPAWEEYRAGTDPTNRESVLAVTNVAVDGVNMLIFWKGGNAATQYLETRGDMAAGQWIPVLTNLPPTPETTNYVDSISTNAILFYRIRAVR